VKVEPGLRNAIERPVIDPMATVVLVEIEGDRVLR
jgi:hypothetical protein